MIDTRERRNPRTDPENIKNLSVGKSEEEREAKRNVKEGGVGKRAGSQGNGEKR